MSPQPIRIWHHSFTVLEKLPPYAEAMAAHFRRVARPETEVVMHGLHPDTYRTNYPGNDIQYGYFQTLHAQQFLMGAVKAEEQGFDAFAMMTLPEPRNPASRNAAAWWISPWWAMARAR